MTPFSQRNATFDFAKVIAVFGIVLFHTGAPGGQIGHAGLMFLVMLLVFLALPQSVAVQSKSPFGDYANSRGRRLILPWLIWCGVYGALKVTEVFITSAPLASEFSAQMWFTGTAPHLWILPFGFVVCLCVYPLGRLMMSLKMVARLPLIMLLVGVALLIQGIAQPPVPMSPAANWITAVPAALLAAAFALSGGHAIRILMITLPFSVIAGATGWTVGLMPIGLGAMLLSLCCIGHVSAGAWSSFASRAAFGVYLLHPAIASVIIRGGVMTPQTFDFAVVVGAIAFGFVVLTETIISRQPSRSSVAA